MQQQEQYTVSTVSSSSPSAPQVFRQQSEESARQPSPATFDSMPAGISGFSAFLASPHNLEDEMPPPQ